MIKDHFYPISLQTANEGEFIQLQQGSMSVPEYASKFMELSWSVPGLHSWREAKDEPVRGRTQPHH